MDEITAIGALIGTAVATAVAWSLAASQRQKRLTREMHANWWRPVAETLGGELDVGEDGFWRSRPVSLFVELEGAGVLAYVFTRIVGNTRKHWTVIYAMYLMPNGPTFDLQPKTVLASIGAIGRKRTMDDPRIDASFVLKTNDREGTRRAFTDDARKRMASLTKWIVVGKGRFVIAQRHGVESDGEALESILRVVADVARVGLDKLLTLRSVPNTSYVPPEGEWNARTAPRLEIAGPGGVVEVEFEARDGDLTLVAAFPMPRPLPAFAVAVDSKGARTGELPEGLLSSESSVALDGLGPAELRCDGADLHLALLGDESLHERLTVAAMLLPEIAHATPHEGVFR